MVVVPTTNVEPEAGLHVRVGLGSTSSMTLTLYETVAPDEEVA